MFEALGDASRRRIMALLASGEEPVGALVASMQEQARISQPAISQHLKVLRAAGLVTVRVDGNRRLYAVDERGLGVARAWLTSLDDPLASFTQPLDALATEVARGRRVQRQQTTDRSARSA